MLQAWGEDAESLFATAVKLRRLGPRRVVVKLPLTAAGLTAAGRLRQRFPRKSRGGRVKICMTACYSARQGLLAAGLRAEYIAPYLGRMGDRGMDGARECADMHTAIAGSEGPTRVLV